MPSLYDTRRYLTDFDSQRIGHVVTDVLVVGSGVAGARAAIEAAGFGSVTVICKGAFDDSATAYAQGGVAAAVAADDSPERHFDDTMRVGCGLNDPAAVKLLVGEASHRMEELLEWGLAVDRSDGELALGREGGHSVNRVIHARGDQTGRELGRTLERRVRQTEHIRVFDDCYLLDFVVLDGVCVGATTYHPRHGHQLIWAKQVILASGGCGRIWRETTNPPVSTGDGLAAAFRAGAVLRDMEFMQFHPTTLYVAGAGRALISEAVRGEGAYLVDRAGERFMKQFHPDAGLAPRDIVSRAIHEHLLATRSNCAYLDARHIHGFVERFPYIAKLCADFEIDVTKELIPVRPSAHYLVGGVAVDLEGRTSIEGLRCCGEAASSGVHGANRMASNSLLEGLVFGTLTGEAAGREAEGQPNRAPLKRIAHRNPDSKRTGLDLQDICHSLRSLMWRNVGIIRHGDRLAETTDILDFWGHYTLDKTFDARPGWETQNQLTVAKLVALSAAARRESIGVHYRADWTGSNGASRYHTDISRADGGSTPRRSEAA